MKYLSILFILFISCNRTEQPLACNSKNTVKYNALIESFGTENVFKDDVARYAAMPCDSGKVVFTGSSTITGWSTLEETFKAFSAKQRGIGGSNIRQIISHSETLVFVNHPATLVLYIGDNDAYSIDFDLYKEYLDCFVANFFHRLPTSRLILIAVKPSPVRKDKWEYYRQVNAYQREIAQRDKRVSFVDLYTSVYNNLSVFSKDGLHLNENGYETLKKLLVEIL